ncbi:hypothetical protein COHA_008059 [Chlorella ohadii]|uniref:Major facilitator superfamily (MFS) profile domain-containing protein n=1 Tax=Chlorella ohadii TaxID=2649997 RepID=A0AAD5H1Z0_9CHLO|nr:hypothetical protein COHA_008059 [Chlorella ohadii]
MAVVVAVAYLGKAVACDWGLSGGQESVLLAIGNAGSLVGLYLFGAAADTAGRKPSLMASALLQCAFGAASAAAPNYGSLVFFRFMHGLAIAGALSALILLAEMLPPANRALWSTVMQFLSVPAYLYEAGIGWATLREPNGWRWMVAALVLPAALLAIAMLFVSESPFWLVTRGRYGEAEAVVHKIAQVNRWAGRSDLHLCFNADSASEDVETAPSAAEGSCGGKDESAQDDSKEPAAAPSEVAAAEGAAGTTAAAASGSRAAKACKAATEAWRDTANGLKTLFSRRLLRTTVLLIITWACSGFIYMGIVLLTPAIGGGDGTTPECLADGTASWSNADFTAVMVTSVAEAPGMIVVMLLSDRIGRRWTLDVLFGASALGSILLASKTWAFGWQLAILFVVRAGIAGVYACLYVFTLEVYPTHARNFGAAVADGWGRIGGFASPFAVVPFIDQGAAWKVATILASLCGAAIVCCLLLPVETMGRGLSRRATRTRSLVPRGSRELPPDPAGNTSDPDKEAEG